MAPTVNPAPCREWQHSLQNRRSQVLFAYLRSVLTWVAEMPGAKFSRGEKLIRNT